jgi:hypothetical protein
MQRGTPESLSDPSSTNFCVCLQASVCEPLLFGGAYFLKEFKRGGIHTTP